MKLIARQHEIKLLNKMLSSKKAEFLAIFGRRRVGKTYLIRAFFSRRKSVFFDATGLKNGDLQAQIFNFTQRIGDVFFDGVMPQAQKGWKETFRLLTDRFNQIPSATKIVIFLDELPWMATRRSKLLETIDYYWNQYWSKDSRIKLIVCGSSASWIINKVVHNKGGLYNRVTETIHLKPFTLSETQQYLNEHKVRLKKKQLVELYMAVGGVPFYLSKIESGSSSAQAIELLAFNDKALLFDEFNNLFASLFDNADAYIEIVKVIAQYHSGISQESLLRQLKKTSKGKTSIKRFSDLVDAGFITRFTPHISTKRASFYRLSDEYTLFYLYWVEPLRLTKMVDSMPTGYWRTVCSTPKWFSWAGYTFENICYKHIDKIRMALNLSPTAIPNAWSYTPSKSNPHGMGAQIDLLFDRDDDSITICEIKYTTKQFEITKDYAAKILNKLSVFKRVTGTKKQLFVAMISASGLKRNKYSVELIDQVVTLDDLFEAN